MSTDETETSGMYHIGWDGEAFECPNCERTVRSPFGGHTWTCHEVYGGCGWSFKPVQALRRVDAENTDTDRSADGEGER